MSLGHLLPHLALFPMIIPSIGTSIVSSYPAVDRTTAADHGLPSTSQHGASVRVVSASLWRAAFAVDAERLLSLSEGWDGSGAKPIEREMLKKAFSCLGIALNGLEGSIAPILVPTGDGGVQIEWHEAHGELELAISPNGELWAWARDHLTGGEAEAGGEKALALFYHWAPWVAAGSRYEADVSLPKEGSVFSIAA